MRQLRKKEAKKIFKKQEKRQKEVVLVLDNILYATNVANIFRTCEASGVSKLYLGGVTKSPPFGKDLQKVSRGSERKVNYENSVDTVETLKNLKKEGFTIIAIELTDQTILLQDLGNFLEGKKKVCFVAGGEDSGISKKVLEICDFSVTIPMYGNNGSLNVNVSVGIVLYSF